MDRGGDLLIYPILRGWELTRESTLARKHNYIMLRYTL
jgi:hypothetical protein